MTRPEATGRKPGATAGPAKQEADDEPPAPPKLLAFTIPQFCSAHGISAGMYFKLKNQDKGPREMRVGAKILISHEAAADWRVERENDTEAAERAERVWVEARKPKPDKPAISVSKPSKVAPKAKRAAKLAGAEA